LSGGFRCYFRSSSFVGHLHSSTHSIARSRQGWPNRTSGVACPSDSASARIARLPFEGPFTAEAPGCAGASAETAPGANRRACIYIPGAKGTMCANVWPGCGHSRRRRLPGSGASEIAPRKVPPRCHLRWKSPATMEPRLHRRGKGLYRRRRCGTKAPTRPASLCHARSALPFSWACPFQ
jgi:hypothetical protein